MTLAEPGAAHRKLGQSLVWAWARDKWPELVPPPALLPPAFDRTVAGARLQARTGAEDGTWTFTVSHRERNSARAWTTSARITEQGRGSVFALQTACSDPPDSRPLAPPAFLRSWVRRLNLQDGGIPVLAEPTTIESEDRLAVLVDNMLSGERRLPILALVSKPQVRYFGVDPVALAEAIGGLAHVVCLAPGMAARLAERFGRNLAPVHGFARFYLSGFSGDAVSRAHPLLRLSIAPASDDQAPASAGAIRRAVSRKACELSVLEGR